MAQVLGRGGNGVIMSSDTTISGTTTLDTSQNWASIGPVTIAGGTTVTVNANAYWTIL